MKRRDAFQAEIKEAAERYGQAVAAQRLRDAEAAELQRLHATRLRESNRYAPCVPVPSDLLNERQAHESIIGAGASFVSAGINLEIAVLGNIVRDSTRAMECMEVVDEMHPIPPVQRPGPIIFSNPAPEPTPEPPPAPRPAPIPHHQQVTAHQIQFSIDAGRRSCRIGYGFRF